MQLSRLLFGRATDDRAISLGLLLLRLAGGLSLAFAHGLGKVPPTERFVSRVAGIGFPAPEPFAWLAGIAEFGGGLLLAIGLFTRPVALLVVVQMLIVVTLAHAGDPFGRRELPLLFLAIAGALALAGGGRYSADALIRREDDGVANDR